MWWCARSSARKRAAWLIVAAAVSSSSCGYALAGRGSFLPESIRTIGIPTFTNATAYFEIGDILTERVRTEFIGRTRYQIVPEADGVDARLEGQITVISVVPASFTQQQQVSRYVITLQANVVLRNLQTDAVIWSNPAMSFQDEYEAAGIVGATDVATFFGQESNAVQRVATEFARALASAVLEAF